MKCEDNREEGTFSHTKHNDIQIKFDNLAKFINDISRYQIHTIDISHYQIHTIRKNPPLSDDKIPFKHLSNIIC